LAKETITIYCPVVKNCYIGLVIKLNPYQTSVPVPDKEASGKPLANGNICNKQWTLLMLQNHQMRELAAVVNAATNKLKKQDKEKQEKAAAVAATGED